MSNNGDGWVELHCRACEHTVQPVWVTDDRGEPVAVCSWCFAPVDVRHWPADGSFVTMLDLGEGRAWNVGPRKAAIDDPNVDWDEANAIAREVAR